MIAIKCTQNNYSARFKFFPQPDLASEFFRLEKGAEGGANKLVEEFVLLYGMRFYGNLDIAGEFLKAWHAGPYKVRLGLP